MEKGVDGFRLDAVVHMHENTSYYKCDEPRSNKPNATDVSKNTVALFDLVIHGFGCFCLNMVAYI